MTRAEIVTVTCDRAECGDTPASPHRVSIDGRAVEIDLCGYHLEALTGFLAAGRKPAARPAAPRPGRPIGTETARRRRAAAIRAWAVSEGLVAAGSLGRMPVAVVAQYDAAHGGAS